MKGFLTAVRCDVLVQGRNGFYWASGFVVLVITTLLSALPADARNTPAVWVPALAAFNLQITTFFFVAGLLLLERDEGTLTALGVSPMPARTYMAVRTTTLTTLAAAETLVIAWFGSGFAASWALIAGIAALGVTYTGLGVAVAAQYDSVNRLLLPASVIVTFLLLPLLGHFQLVPRLTFAWHPMDPAINLIRTAYEPTALGVLASYTTGALVWAVVAFRLAQGAIARAMRDTRASGGR